MKKMTILLLLLFGSGDFLLSSSSSDGKAYIIYKQANALYRNKQFSDAQKKYLKLVSDYSSSKYVPYALYILSFVSHNAVKSMDYLSLIRDEHPDFKYWDQAVLRLGEIYYLFGNNEAALNQFKMIETDRARYLSAIIYSAQKKDRACYEEVQKLLNQSSDYFYSYVGFILQAKSLINLKKYDAALSLLQEAVKLNRYSKDRGGRLLFYTGKAFFLKKKVGEAFYVFSLLKKRLPFSAEASLSTRYLDYLIKHSVVTAVPVNWIDHSFGEVADIAFKTEAGIEYTDEEQAEKMVHAAEDEIGKVLSSEVVEYVVRIGSYKDLGVANLVAADLSKPPYNMPVGIYFRKNLYYAEIRGIRDKKEAKNTASKLISLGYKTTKVIEMTKVVEYGR